MNERIKELVNAKCNGSILAFSKILDMPQTSVNAMISGKMKISQKLIVAVVTTFPDLSAEWLLRGKEPMLLTDTPQEGAKKETTPAHHPPTRHDAIRRTTHRIPQDRA